MKRIFLTIATVGFLVAPAYADAKSNIESIAASLESLGLAWENTGGEICLRENFCSILTGEIQIQAIAKTIDVMPTSQEPADVYLMACTAALAGLTGAPVEAAADNVVRGTLESAMGMSRQDFGAVRMTMERDSSGELTCSFVKA